MPKRKAPSSPIFSLRSLTLLGSLLSAGLHAADPSAGSGQTKPNVLFINIDDLRCDTGCYRVTASGAERDARGGHPLVKTPNMDKLAARGMLFEQAHVQATFCNPSRNSFLTGLRPDTTGSFDNKTPLFDTLPDAITLPRLFRDNGYYTYRLGKIFHSKEKFDDPKAWDKVDYTKTTETGRQGEGRNLTGGTVTWCQWKACEGTDEDQMDGQVAKGAVEFLRNKPKQPFFLAVGFHKPHDPFFAPKKYFEHYPIEKLRPLLHRDPEDMTPLPRRHISSAWWAEFKKFTDQERLEFMRSSYACTTFMDAQLGKVLDALRDEGLEKNTVILLLSDHGYHLGEREWWNKSTLLTYSTRAPLIAWTPTMKAGGKRCSASSSSLTSIRLSPNSAASSLPPGLEGKSFAPLLDNPDQPWKTAAFSQLGRGKNMGRAIRTKDWRYIEWAEGSQGIELYDCTKDPGEFHNLARDPGHADTRARLRKILRGERQSP